MDTIEGPFKKLETYLIEKIKGVVRTSSSPKNRGKMFPPLVKSLSSSLKGFLYMLTFCAPKRLRSLRISKLEYQYKNWYGMRTRFKV